MAMRAITFSPLRTRSRPLFTSLGVSDVYNLHELAVSNLYMIYTRDIYHIL